MADHPLNGKQVKGPCIRCAREPRQGEMYGTRAKDWDFTNFCPECWDAAFLLENDA